MRHGRLLIAVIGIVTMLLLISGGDIVGLVEEVGDFLYGLSIIFRLLLPWLLIFAIYILFTDPAAPLRWYYMLKPHPATKAINRAISANKPIDGAALAALLAPIPGSQAEQQVRAQQASALATRARQHTEALLAEAEYLKKKAEKEAAYILSQDALARATMIHEQARARLDVLKRILGHDGSEGSARKAAEH